MKRSKNLLLPPPFLKIVEPDEKKDLERDGDR